MEIIRKALPLLLFSLCFISCDESITIQEPDSTTDKDGADFGYFYVLGLGNYWQYETDDGLTKFEIIDKKIIDQEDIFILKDNFGEENSYKYVDGIGYGTTILTPGAEPIEIPLLNDNVSIGDSWNFTINLTVLGVNSETRYTNEVVEVLTDYTVNGTSYNEVKHIYQESFNKIDDNPEFKSSSSDFYWAKNIGLVHAIYYSDYDELDPSILTEYHIE